MKKKNKKLILIIVIIALVIGLGGFIIFSKVLNNNEPINEINDNQVNVPKQETEKNENKLENIPNNIGDNSETKTYFSEYLKYIPLRYTNSKLSDYDLTNLTKTEISMSVWRYVWNNSDYHLLKKTSEEKVNAFLKRYYDFSNYEIEELKIKDDHLYGLSKKDGYYEATALTTKSAFSNFEITDISYDNNNQKVVIKANDVQYEMGSADKKVVSNVTIEFKQNGNNFNIVSFKVNK